MSQNISFHRPQFSLTFYYFSIRNLPLPLPLCSVYSDVHSHSVHHGDVPDRLGTDHSSKLIMINVFGLSMQMINSGDGLTMLNWSNFNLMCSPDICWIHLLNDIKTYYLHGAARQSDTYERMEIAVSCQGSYLRPVYLHSSETKTKWWRTAAIHLNGGRQKWKPTRPLRTCDVCYLSFCMFSSEDETFEQILGLNTGTNY